MPSRTHAAAARGCCCSVARAAWIAAAASESTPARAIGGSGTAVRCCQRCQAIAAPSAMRQRRPLMAASLRAPHFSSLTGGPPVGRALSGAFAFPQRDRPVCRAAREVLLDAVRPEDLDMLDPFHLSKSEVRSGIVAGQVAVTWID